MKNTIKTTGIKMICRECKREYNSNAYKKSGSIYGFCCLRCEKNHIKKCSPSPLSKILIKEIKRIEVKA